MGESLVEAPKVDTKMGESFTHLPCLQESVSFGRFEHDSLCWERWSTFPTNKYLEEVEKCSTPGSVAQKKAYFEAHYKRIAARKAELLDQERKREEDEYVNSGNRSPVGSMCNTSEEEFDVEKPSTQNSVDGTEVLGEVGGSTDEVSVKHIDIIGYGADIIIEEGGAADLTSEVSQHSDDLSYLVDVDEVNEEADILVEHSEHIDELSDHFDFTDEVNEVIDIMVEKSEYIDKLNDEAGLAEEKEDIQTEHFEIKENKDKQPLDTDEAGVADEKRDSQPGRIIESNSGINLNKENKDTQPQIVDVNEDSCLKVDISHLDKPDEPVLVKEDTSSARVWQDKEVLSQEKVDESKIAEKGTKNPIKLVDPVKTKKTTLVKRTIDTMNIKKKPASPIPAALVKKKTDTINSKKKPASPIPKKTAAPMPKSPIMSTPKPSKPELTKTAKSTTRPSVKKENGYTPLTSKKVTRPESKRVLPTSLHMSFSLGPANSEPANSDPASLIPMRNSLIMERMGDKDIVKRAFKAFRNVNQLSPSSLVKPTTPNQSATKRIEVKITTLDNLQKKKEGISGTGKPISPITGPQGTKKTSQSPGLKRNIGVDQRNVKAVSASFGYRSLDQGRLQREDPRKLEPKYNMKDSGKTDLQSKLKAEKAAAIGKPTRSINSKTKLSSSYNQGHGFLRGSVRKVDARI